jgi:hypothetical protein
VLEAVVTGAQYEGISVISSDEDRSNISLVSVSPFWNNSLFVN